MIGFLLQDGVSDVFLGYITQVGGGPRPTSALETQTEALKLSYRLEYVQIVQFRVLCLLFMIFCVMYEQINCTFDS